MVITGASILLLPMSTFLPAWIIIISGILLTVVYCAASDVLLVARMISYAVIVLGEPVESSATAEGKLETPLYSAPPDLRS